MVFGGRFGETAFVRSQHKKAQVIEIEVHAEILASKIGAFGISEGSIQKIPIVQRCKRIDHCGHLKTSLECAMQKLGTQCEIFGRFD